MVSSIGDVWRLMSQTKLRLDAGEGEGEVLGVAEEVGVGGEDLEGLGRGYGADQEIGRRALETLLAATVAELAGHPERPPHLASRRRLRPRVPLRKDPPA